MSLTKRGASVGRGPPMRPGHPMWRDWINTAKTKADFPRCSSCGNFLPGVPIMEDPERGTLYIFEGHPLWDTFPVKPKHYCPMKGEYSLGSGRKKE